MKGRKLRYKLMLFLLLAKCGITDTAEALNQLATTASPEIILGCD
jgi:hypothetical protein